MEEDKPQILLWTAPECPYRVTVPTHVINEVRIRAVEAFYSVPRGGVEIGGVFFGERQAGTLHIREHRPVTCQYSTGPSFTLSVKDQIGLSGLLDEASNDPDLKGLEPLGWYHSHTRSEIFLSPADLELYSEFFPERWQIALVVRPANLQPTRAGFFFRNRAGAVKSDAPVQELRLEPPDFDLEPFDANKPAAPAREPEVLAAKAPPVPEIAPLSATALTIVPAVVDRSSLAPAAPIDVILPAPQPVAVAAPPVALVPPSPAPGAFVTPPQADGAESSAAPEKLSATNAVTVDAPPKPQALAIAATAAVIEMPPSATRAVITDASAKPQSTANGPTSIVPERPSSIAASPAAPAATRPTSAAPMKSGYATDFPPAHEPPRSIELTLPDFLKPKPKPQPKPPSRLIWVLAGFLLLVCGAAAAALLNWDRLTRPMDLGLETYDINGAFLIRWDRDSRVVRSATRATLEIQDGSEKPPPIDLTPAELRVGGYGYMRRSGQVSVHMKVDGATPAEEYSTFSTAQALGSMPPSKPGAAPGSDPTLAEHLKTELLNESMQSAALRREITSLRKQLAEERAKSTSAPNQ